ncbi:MAG: peroxide stress protein YaaA, partial [Cyanobacteria bacterium P01_A01_bin.84]
TKLAHFKIKDLSASTLYEFWSNKLTDVVNQQLAKLDQKIIVNLASNEYFRAIQPKLLQGEIITPVFRDWKNGKYKVISFYAKKARGMMTAYIIKNRIVDPQDLKQFSQSDYSYNAELSESNNLVFTRQ